MPALQHTFAPLTGPIPLQYLDDNFLQINNLTRIVSGTPVTRFIQDKLNDWISVKDFGAVGDGTTDDTNAIQQCVNSFGAAGGVAFIPNGMKCLINSNLTIPPNSHIFGPQLFAGAPSNVTALYGNIGGALIINSAATISIGFGSSVRGLIVYRKGMTFPAADGSLFAGTAFTVAGDDAYISNCLITGFNKAFLSNGFGRPRCEYLQLDNTNGIEITSCADIAYIFQCHAWPFSTITSGPGALKDTRQGTAYSFHDFVDWGKYTNCFSWGYLRGFQFNNVNSCTLLNCGTDNLFNGTPQLANSIGVEILGTCQDTRIIGHEAAAQATAGVRINTSAGLHTQIQNLTVWGGSTHAALIDGGDVNIGSGCLRAVTNGVTYNNAVSRVFIDNVRFQGITTTPILTTVTATLLFVGKNNDYGDAGLGASAISGTANLQSVASASVVSIPPSGDGFIITGTTNMGSLSLGWAGRIVTLFFQGALTVISSTGVNNAMRLSGGSNFVTQANSTLTLYHNGVQWFEIGRGT